LISRGFGGLNNLQESDWPDEVDQNDCVRLFVISLLSFLLKNFNQLNILKWDLNPIDEFLVPYLNIYLFWQRIVALNITVGKKTSRKYNCVRV
jgi:hypothetical protein